MPEGKRSGGLYLDEEVWDGIQKLAEKDNRSFNSYVNLVLRLHWEKNKKRKLIKRSAA